MAGIATNNTAKMQKTRWSVSVVGIKDGPGLLLVSSSTRTINELHCCLSSSCLFICDYSFSVCPPSRSLSMRFSRILPNAAAATAVFALQQRSTTSSAGDHRTSENLQNINYGAFTQTATFSVANELGFFQVYGLNVTFLSGTELDLRLCSIIEWWI